MPGRLAVVVGEEHGDGATPLRAFGILERVQPCFHAGQTFRERGFPVFSPGPARPPRRRERGARAFQLPFSRRKRTPPLAVGAFALAAGGRALACLAAEPVHVRDAFQRRLQAVQVVPVVARVAEDHAIAPLSAPAHLAHDAVDFAIRAEPIVLRNNLEGGREAVHVEPLVAAVAQQHLLRVLLAFADLARRVVVIVVALPPPLAPLAHIDRLEDWRRLEQLKRP
mmetsp:Transcript_41171/g.97569  ORF Transcript_41171/g.97569 Transcript_41171/m.97569 type:complete len:225 (-) Transcript_41171:220-894(-)